MKNISVLVQFKTDLNGIEVGEVINKALKNRGINIDKFRTTYVESDRLGMADMPQGLMLALLIGDRGGFGWYLPKLSGTYVFKFQK